MLEREPSLVWLTMTGVRTEVALIGVYLVILGLELDRDLELERERLPLEKPREPPLLPPPLPLAASDNSSNTAVRKRRRSTVVSRILVEESKPSFVVFQLFCSLCSCTEECVTRDVTQILLCVTAGVADVTRTVMC